MDRPGLLFWRKRFMAVMLPEPLFSDPFKEFANVGGKGYWPEASCRVIIFFVWLSQKYDFAFLPAVKQMLKLFMQVYSTPLPACLRMSGCRPPGCSDFPEVWINLSADSSSVEVIGSLKES